VTQRELDPHAMTAPVKESSVETLPYHTRNFGYVPDVAALRPGDLLLFRNVRPNCISRLIGDAQRRAGFSLSHSRWTHVAVFLYDDLMVEAVPGHGVAPRSLYDYVPQRVIRVRRRADLGDVERYEVALRALRKLGARYSHFGVVASAWYFVRGLWNRPDFGGFRHIVICSEIFHDAYAEATRSLLRDCPVDAPVTPAHLSATPDLEDVEVGWVKVV
jgi:hypothetical protein